MTEILVQTFNQSFKYLQKAIDSIGAQSQSYANTNAYKTYFRDVNPADVTKVFQQIMEGANFAIPGTKASNRPRVICTTEETPHMMEICQRAGVSAAWAINTPYVFLCPVFFDVLPLAPSPDNCPTLSPDGTYFVGNAPLKSQYTSLVTQLSRMYLKNLGRRALEPEAIGQIGASSLSPDRAVLNPTSYALYAGSKFTCPLSLSTPLLSLPLFSFSFPLPPQLHLKIPYPSLTPRNH